MPSSIQPSCDMATKYQESVRPITNDLIENIEILLLVLFASFTQYLNMSALSRNKNKWIDPQISIQINVGLPKK